MASTESKSDVAVHSRGTAVGWSNLHMRGLRRNDWNQDEGVRVFGGIARIGASVSTPELKNKKGQKAKTPSDL